MECQFALVLSCFERIRRRLRRKRVDPLRARLRVLMALGRLVAYAKIDGRSKTLHMDYVALVFTISLGLQEEGGER